MAITEFMYYIASGTTVDSKIKFYLHFHISDFRCSLLAEMTEICSSSIVENPEEMSSYSPSTSSKYWFCVSCTSTCTMSKHGNNLRITGPLWGESVPVVCEDRWVPLVRTGSPFVRTGGFPKKIPVMRVFDVSFVVSVLFSKSVQLWIKCATRFHVPVPCPLNGLQWL